VLCACTKEEREERGALEDEQFGWCCKGTGKEWESQEAYSPAKAQRRLGESLLQTFGKRTW